MGIFFKSGMMCYDIELVMCVFYPTQILRSGIDIRMGRRQTAPVYKYVQLCGNRRTSLLGVVKANLD